MLYKYCITKVNKRTYSIMYLCIQHYQFIIVIIIFIVIIIIWKLSTKSNTISPPLCPLLYADSWATFNLIISWRNEFYDFPKYVILWEWWIVWLSNHLAIHLAD